MATVAAAAMPRLSSDRLGLALAKAAGYFLLSYLAATLAWIIIPAVALGWTPLVVTSGSMAPTINRGDVVLIEPGVMPVPGHVIAFPGVEGTPILHRLEHVNDDGTFTTRGDANLQPDSTPVSEISGVGRLLVPGLGYVKLWLPQAGAVLGATMVGALLLGNRTRWSLLLAGGIAVGSIMLVVSATFQATTASTGSNLATVTIAPPIGLQATCSSVSLGSDVPINLSWRASPTGGVTYQIYYDAASPGGGFVLVGSTAATSFTHAILNGQIALGQAHTFRVAAVLGPWTSSEAEDQVTITQVVLVYVCS